MGKTLLNIACCAGCIAVSISVPISALAAGPYQLNPEQDTSFPTWHAGRGTKLCVQNLDGQHSGKVRVKVPLTAPPPEYIEVEPGATNCIDRGWAGFEVNVKNEGQASVKVWTE